MARPYVSIVIPVYNEAGILASAITELTRELQPLGWSYEIIISENGSEDRTHDIAMRLAAEDPAIVAFSVDEPNYGKAMRMGIERARGTFVLCDEIDLCDVDFYRRAMELLERGAAEMVVGSKAMKGAHDERPLFRRIATRILSGMLRVATGFRGTDTHGLKAFRREPLLRVVRECVVDKDLFASEFVIRAGRNGLIVIEIPVRVAEKRLPAIHLIHRAPNVLRNLLRLAYVIRVGERPVNDVSTTGDASDQAQ